MPAIRVKEDLHEKIAQVAQAEGRSAANYLDWVMRPIVDGALEQASNGTTPLATGRTSGEVRSSAAPPARRSTSARTSRNSSHLPTCTCPVCKPARKSA